MAGPHWSSHSPSPLWAPSSSPAAGPASTTTLTTSTSSSDQSTPPTSSNGGVLGVDFSPPLIAMVVVVAAAFLMVTYSRLLSRHLIIILRRCRRWSRRRRRRRFQLPSYSTTFSNLESPPFPFDSSSPDGAAGFHLYSSYGLDDAIIKTIPLSIYNPPANGAVMRDCAVCLLEFEENDYVRTLPACSHPFHVDCIDIWLHSHGNCPLCRAGIFLPDSSPFVPVMSARIRPSLDDAVLVSLLDQANSVEPAPAVTQTAMEITPCVDEASPRRNSLHNFNGSYSEDNRDNRNRLLKRSYSFGFERSSFLTASERMLVTEPATASPWRFRRGSGFWSKRPLTPFKSRVFSLRYYRSGTIMKSPVYFRRRSIGGGGGTFFPLSERFSNAGGGGSSSSRRSKSMASPMFLRSSMAAFSSSRLRCGDPEALLSPERFNRRG